MRIARLLVVILMAALVPLGISRAAHGTSSFETDPNTALLLTQVFPLQYPSASGSNEGSGSSATNFLAFHGTGSGILTSTISVPADSNALGQAHPGGIPSIPGLSGASGAKAANNDGDGGNLANAGSSMTGSYVAAVSGFSDLDFAGGDHGTGGVSDFGLTYELPISGLTPVPEPTSLLLLGSGLAGMGSAAWRRYRQNLARQVADANVAV